MNAEFMQIKRASDVLMNRDPQARDYIAHLAGSAPDDAAKQSGADGVKGKERSALERVYDAVIDGSRDEIIDLIDRATAENVTPQQLVDNAMVPAIQEVGSLYENRVFFLPQLIASAEAMKKGFERLEPLLKSAGTCLKKKGTIVLATVKDDIHDIGKNIVSLMLKNHGFEVIDLGKDVPDREIIDAAVRHKPQAVGLSALMTTTMVRMESIIRQAREAGLSCPFLVGGAVVTKAYADSIGAHYAKDGVDAVRVAQSLVE